jgi:glutamate-1-semialdehyde aminotransferase
MSEHRETTGSSELAERLRRVLPGGDTRSATFYEPYPIAFERGEGYRVVDVDGNEYLDFVNNFTSLVHGHAHPVIVQALVEQVGRGTAFPAPHRAQADLAERIVSRLPSVELLRYTNSGSEANILALRLARANTGRERIVKADGGYHGSWEQLPMTRRDEVGTPAAVSDLIHWCEFNDVDSLRTAVEAAGEELAAIVLEPVQVGGGVIVGTPEFFQAARELADEVGALLVLDEVVTLRLAPGGYQSVLGVEPDLTSFGKIIGGGLPVGATGGRREILEATDPRRPDYIGHSGPRSRAVRRWTCWMRMRSRGSTRSANGLRAASPQFSRSTGSRPPSPRVDHSSRFTWRRPDPCVRSRTRIRAARCSRSCTALRSRRACSSPAAVSGISRLSWMSGSSTTRWTGSHERRQDSTAPPWG